MPKTELQEALHSRIKRSGWRKVVLHKTKGPTNTGIYPNSYKIKFQVAAVSKEASQVAIVQRQTMLSSNKLPKWDMTWRLSKNSLNSTVQETSEK
jgi:hypothetical protein